jgi:hypothetical protein
VALVRRVGPTVRSGEGRWRGDRECLNGRTSNRAECRVPMLLPLRKLTVMQADALHAARLAARLPQPHPDTAAFLEQGVMSDRLLEHLIQLRSDQK